MRGRAGLLPRGSSLPADGATVAGSAYAKARASDASAKAPGVEARANGTARVDIEATFAGLRDSMAARRLRGQLPVSPR